jgi:chromosome segregation ATPase
MGTARHEFQSFVQRHGNGVEQNVPEARQAEMNRLKNLFNDLKNQYSTINAEKERLTADLAFLKEKLASQTITIDVSVIRQQQEEIAQEKEVISAMEQALEKQQARLDDVMDSQFEDLHIIHHDLLAEKAMGKDVSEALAASEEAIANQAALAKSTKEEEQEIKMTISGLTKKIEDTKRHLRYLENDKKQMVLQFLKMESDKTEKNYVETVESLIESYCRLRSLDTLISQVSDNKEGSFITANAYNFNIPAIGPNTAPNDFLFIAGQFQQYGDCLQKEKARLLNLGVQC